MKVFTSMVIALRALFRRRAAEAELDEELRGHLQMEIEHNIAQGMTPAEAERAARVSFGGIEQTKEASRDAWGWRILPDFGRDTVYALGALRRTPGFTLIALLTLGLGIGVNMVMFSFVRDSVVRPQLRDHALDLTAVYNAREGADRGFRHFSYAEFEHLRRSPEVFAEVAAVTFRSLAVGLPNDQQRRMVGFVSDNYLSLIGTTPWRGRFFNATEGEPDASIPVAVASHSMWARLGFPDDLVGRSIRVNQRDYTVVGITPPGFVGLHVSVGPDVWLPLGEVHHFEGESLRVPTNHPLAIVARFAAGVSPKSARSLLPAIAAGLDALPAADGPRALVLHPPSRTNLGSSSPGNETFLHLFAGLSMGLSAAVLIVACLNLANMVLARGAARRQEIAIRLSLGASRGRIVRQLTTEGLVLAVLGGFVGLFFSLWADAGMRHFANQVFATSTMSASFTPLVDRWMIGVTLVCCIGATLTSSLGPALRLTRLDLVTDLKQARPGPGGTAGWRRLFDLGSSLVIAQIALSLALLFSASLFVRSSLDARTIPLGFEKENQLVANLDYRATELSAAAVRQRQSALLDHFAPLLGPGQVALASNVPYNFELPVERVFATADFAPIDPDQANAGGTRAGVTAVSQNYFSLLGIALQRGRTFTVAEGTRADGPGVAIIDESLARSLFGEADPLGRHVFLEEDAAAAGGVERALEIVGVVRSPREEIFADEPPPRIYRPLGQAPAANIYLHLGTPEPLRRVETIRRELSAFDPATPVLLVRPLASFVDENINGLVVELAAIVFGLFGGIALLLAVVGVYGVKAHAVSRRRREIGIRMALGARPEEVMGLILRQGALQTLVGLGIGGVLSLFAGNVLASMLYQADAGNSWALAGCAVFLALAVLAACWVPARRATRVDPALTLRAE